MIYPTENCYPDVLDLQGVLRKIRPTEDPKTIAATIFQDYRASFEWLSVAMHACHWAGRHSYRPLSEVKTIAEGFVGRPLNETAFLAAAMTDGCKLRYANEDFSEVKIKTPPFDSAKIAPLWQQHQED